MRNVDAEIFKIGPSMSYVEEVSLLRKDSRGDMGICCRNEHDWMALGTCLLKDHSVIETFF